MYNLTKKFSKLKYNSFIFIKINLIILNYYQLFPSKYSKMSATNNTKTKKITKPAESVLVQFNQIKGKKTGKSDKNHQWAHDPDTNLL